jgi:hypothetical protein
MPARQGLDGARASRHDVCCPGTFSARASASIFDEAVTMSAQ